jgi:hypothetical protein
MTKTLIPALALGGVLLGLSPSAQAACAWMLWGGEKTMMHTWWELHSAYPTATECTKGLQAAVDTQAADLETQGFQTRKTVVPQRGEIAFGVKSFQFTKVWQCFPETFTPRMKNLVDP